MLLPVLVGSCGLVISKYLQLLKMPGKVWLFTRTFEMSDPSEDNSDCPKTDFVCVYVDISSFIGR